MPAYIRSENINLREINKKFIHHRVTEDTEDNETRKISEILCALCASVVHPQFAAGFGK
jgi:hypothetical protein